MDINIKYHVSKSFFPFSLFSKEGILSIDDKELIIKGDTNYVIPFSQISLLSRYMFRLGIGVYIVFRFGRKKFYLRVPNTQCLSSNSNYDTEWLFQAIQKKMNINSEPGTAG